LSIGLLAARAQRGFAAKWGSQSWLQPAFQPARLDYTSGRSRLESRLQAELPAPQ